MIHMVLPISNLMRSQSRSSSPRCPSKTNRNKHGRTVILSIYPAALVMPHFFPSRNSRARKTYFQSFQELSSYVRRPSLSGKRQKHCSYSIWHSRRKSNYIHGMKKLNQNREMAPQPGKGSSISCQINQIWRRHKTEKHAAKQHT